MQPPRVYVHRGLGPRITEISTAISIERGWRLPGVSQGSFLLALDDPDRALLDPREGNAIVIESDHYPLPWVGAVQAVEEDWAGGQIDVSMTGLEGILRDRLVGITAFGSSTAGSAVRELVEGITSSTGIVASPDIAGGPPLGRTQMPDRTVYGALDAIAQQCGCEWWIDVDATPQGITASVEFQMARGARSGVVLVHGGNCDVASSRISGRSIYSTRLVGGQTSVLTAYTARPRSTVLTQDAPHAPIHGYEIEHSDHAVSALTRREAVIHAENLTSVGALTQAAEYISRRGSIVERLLDIRVTVEDDDLWSELMPGNVVGFRSSNVFLGAGLSGAVRIRSVQPKEELGDLTLVGQVMGVRRG